MIITPFGIACIAAIGGLCGGVIALLLVRPRPAEWVLGERDKGWREPFDLVDGTTMGAYHENRARESKVKDVVFGTVRKPKGGA